jgi:c-di-GMP-binding flagellar brake protein YcgR
MTIYQLDNADNDRRESFRINDHLLLEYWLEGEPCPSLPLKYPGLASTDVNISGTGIAFYSSRSFQVGDQLEIRIILPPFVPIRLKAEVLRVQPGKEDLQGYFIAGRFISISYEDREHIIRHILKVQKKQLQERYRD